jgi:16S rRNA (cytidine1402-2'-O)-methyltransferase
MNINSLSGVLYIVATPIGNLNDISLRALEILKSVDCILAEDTRHSQQLLQNFSLKTPLIALHEHNERERVLQLLQRISKGETMALISDAGTPLISDPGYHLVREARLAGIKIIPIPGACAAVAALSVAGLPTDRFVFEGFLPAKTAARAQRLERLRQESRTMVFYEAPHRLLNLLAALRLAFGDSREAVIARELTKLFETIAGGTVAELEAWVAGDANQQKGEIVVIVAGLTEISSDESAEGLRILTILLAELPLKQASELTAKITGQKKNAVYNTALTLKNNPS